MAKEARSKLPVEVLFIGECGSGKSSTINHLLGKKVCKTGKTFNREGITREIERYRIRTSNAAMALDSEDEDSFDNEQNTKVGNFTEGKNTTYELTNEEETSEVKHTSLGIRGPVDKNKEMQVAENKDTETKVGPQRKTKHRSKNAKSSSTRTKTLLEELTDEIYLYDTPTFKETIDCFKKSRQGFHAIALVFPMTRYTDDRRKFLEDVCKAFDEKLFKHIIIIFTNTECLEGDVDEEVNTVAENEKVFKKFISESKKRYIVCKREFKDEEERNAFKSSFYEKLKDILHHEEELVSLSQRSLFGFLAR